MSWLGVELGITSMEGWYNLTIEDLKKHNGEHLLRKFSSSPSKLLQGIFPEHGWNFWQFKTIPKGYFNDRSHQELFMARMGAKLGIKELKEWDQVTWQEIAQEKGGAALLAKYKHSVAKLLRGIFPDGAWPKHHNRPF